MAIDWAKRLLLHSRDLDADGHDTTGGGGASELAYAQITSGINPTATTEATADTVVTAAEITVSGTDIILVEFYTGNARGGSSTNQHLRLWLYDGSSSIGRIGFVGQSAPNTPCYCARRLTPSNGAHTYSIRASVDGGSGLVQAGAGGAGTDPPAFIRITRAT